MAYRSWLEDVKKINDLGEFCHNVEWTEESAAQIDEFDQKWLARLMADDLPVDISSKDFFGSRMHDSYVQTFTATGSNLEITIHNDYAEEFVKAYFRALSIKGAMPVLHVQLIFEDVRYLAMCIQDESGELHKCEIPDTKVRAKPTHDIRFPYDWFHQVDGRIQWIAEIDATDVTVHTKARAYYAHLLVDCARASAVDRRDSAIEKALGKECFEAWLACKEHFSTRSWGCYLIEDFIRERQLGLPKS